MTQRLTLIRYIMRHCAESGHSVEEVISPITEKAIAERDRLITRLNAELGFSYHKIADMTDVTPDYARDVCKRDMAMKTVGWG